MKKGKQWKSAFLWFFGVVGAGVTVLSLAAVVIGFVHHVPFDILSDAVYTWAAVFFIIAVVPMLMVLFGVADDRFVQETAEMGKLTLLFGNPFGLIYSALALLYRRALKPSPTFWLLMSIFVPTQYPKDD